MSKFGFGQSKVNTWRRCKQEYHYKFVENLQRKLTKRPFMFGKIVHRLLEANAEGEDPMEILDQIDIDNLDIFTSEKEMYGEIVQDIRTIMADYFRYYEDDGVKLIPFDDENGKTRYTEHEFAVEVEDGLIFKGQIDAVAKRDGLRWVMENKTFDKMPNEDHRWRNLQTVVYAYALEVMGWLKHVDGVLWNYIWSHPPTIPKELKSGGLSKAANIVTLPAVWRRQIKKLGLNKDDYREQIDIAKGNRDRYFQRIFTPINRTVADKIWNGFLDDAREMRDTHGRTPRMNLGRHCEWCDYEPICRATLTGGDVDFVKEREYINEDPEAYRRSKRDEITGLPRRKPAVTSPKLRVVR